MTAGFLFVAVALLVGVVLRIRLVLFQRLYIPASVIAGTLGLLTIQLGNAMHRAAAASDSSVSPAVSWLATEQWSTTLRSWPGWLIAVVFAGMLLEREGASLRESLSRVGRQGLMVWVIVLGQTTVGLIVTWLLVQPFYDVPNSFGMLIETGFSGGHGTAAAMGQVFTHPTIGLENGLDLGVLVATCGLVYGVVSGIVFVNLGVRRGWTGKWLEGKRADDRNSHSSKVDFNGLEKIDTDASDRRSGIGLPIGYARISSETIDPLLMQVVWLAIAFGIGIGLHSAVSHGVMTFESIFSGMDSDAGLNPGNQLDGRLRPHQIVDSFPLFIYTLFGGLAVRKVLQWTGYQHVIDRETINRLTATAMDILVVAAIASLNLSAVATLLVPLTMLLLAGAIWSAVCLLVLARWMLPRQHWFELGLINYGMSTGTTATGFVLLRLVDPELESGAAEDYALAAPLSSPFIGGGMITVGLPLLVLERVPLVSVCVTLTLLVVAMVIIGRRWNAAADS